MMVRGNQPMYVRFDLQISKRVLSRLMQKPIVSPNSLEAGLYKKSLFTLAYLIQKSAEELRKPSSQTVLQT